MVSRRSTGQGTTNAVGIWVSGAEPMGVFTVTYLAYFIEVLLHIHPWDFDGIPFHHARSGQPMGSYS